MRRVPPIPSKLRQDIKKPAFPKDRNKDSQKHINLPLSKVRRFGYWLDSIGLIGYSAVTIYVAYSNIEMAVGEFIRTYWLIYLGFALYAVLMSKHHR